MKAERAWHPETIAVAAGRDESPGAPLNVPPTLVSAFRDGGPIAYSREGNPTWGAFEQAMGALEGGRAVAFASGQAAIAALISTLPVGGRVMAPDGCYLGTRALLKDLGNKGRLCLQLVDITDTRAVLTALPTTDMAWVESPTNPLLGVADLPAILQAASAAGVLTVVDNTFATPLVQQPLRWGATAVVHSVTKYIGGHSDLLMGAVVVATDDLYTTLAHQRSLQGAVPGAFEAYLALRGMRTLPVRLARQQATAQVLAERLAGHPAVTRVRYPGLSSDPFHGRARAQMQGFGAIVSFEVANRQAAEELVASLRLIVPATSLGGVETTLERRNRWPGEEAVPPALLRLSVGLEHPDDLWADLEQALAGRGHVM
jgi:cystathionine gamma-synthase